MPIFNVTISRQREIKDYLLRQIEADSAAQAQAIAAKLVIDAKKSGDIELKSLGTFINRKVTKSGASSLTSDENGMFIAVAEEDLNAAKEALGLRGGDRGEDGGLRSLLNALSAADRAE